MRRAASGALVSALVILVFIAVAPAVLAGAMAPRVTLKGPGEAGLNEQVTLNGTVANTNGGEGAMYVVIQQKIEHRLEGSSPRRSRAGPTATMAGSMR